MNHSAQHSKTRHPLLSRLFIFLCACVFVAGCGGGGGSGPRPLAAAIPEIGSPAPPPTQQPDTPEQPPQPPPSGSTGCITLHDGTCASIPDFNARAAQLAQGYADHPAFQFQWGLGSIGADRAYAHVNLLEGESAAPGAGVTIGFIDSGIDLEHPVFEGKTVTEVFMSDAVDETGEERFSHGTAVASIAAGVRDHSRPGGHQGVAWGADIAMFAIPLGVSDGVYRPISLEGLAGADAETAQNFNQVLRWHDGGRRVDILNLSFGFQGLIDDYGEADLRANFSQAIAAMAQAGVNDKAILVWAAGNSNGDSCETSVPNCEDGALNAVSPSLLSGLPARIPELRGHIIAVAALKPNDEVGLKSSSETIVSYSNRCGIAADFCIAAPGDAVRVAYFGPSGGAALRTFGAGGGTSFAAPMVAGGLAIMKQIFRDQLSSEELVTRLLETADDTGVYSDRAVYGRGKLDLAAATHPVGVLKVPVTATRVANAYQAGRNLSGTGLSLGYAFGGGLARSVMGRELMAIDDLGAPFWYRLEDFVATAKGPAVDARVRGFLAKPTGEYRKPGVRVRATSSADSGHLSLAEGGLMATFTNRAGLSASLFGSHLEREAVGGALGWRPEGSPLGLRLGWIGEDESILGGVGHGAFGSLSADTAFVRVEGDVRLGAWRLGANAEWGSVRPRARGGLIDGVSGISTSAFAVHARAAVNRQGRGSLFRLTAPARRGRPRIAHAARGANQVRRDTARLFRARPRARRAADRPIRHLGEAAGGREAATGRRLEPEPRPQRVRRPDPHVPRGLAAGVLSVAARNTISVEENMRGMDRTSPGRTGPGPWGSLKRCSCRNRSPRNSRPDTPKLSPSPGNTPSPQMRRHAA